MLEGNFALLPYQENRRLRAAFSISFLFHIGILWLLWQPLLLMRATNMGSLTVSFFTSPMPAIPKAPESTERDNESTPQSAKTPVEHPIAQSLTQARSAASIPANATAARPGKVESAATKKSNAAGTARASLAYGQASIVMLIDHNGRPGEIYWRELPALTDEQLHLVELRLRRHRYDKAKRGTAVTAVINVFEILREPVRADKAIAPPDSVLPAPTGEPGITNPP